MSAWASVQGGKWHRIPAPVTRENYRVEHHSSCGVSFRVFNSHDRGRRSHRLDERALGACDSERR